MLALLSLPLLDLIDQARAVHRRHHEDGEVQLASLLSIKTGGCPEDCGYCPQASRYHTGVDNQAIAGALRAIVEELETVQSGPPDAES